MEFRLLGPIAVRRDGTTLDLGVYKQRALLALLLINANRVVSTDRIIDELWGDDSGRDRQSALWVVVSRLRSVLEPERERRTDGTVLVTRAPGYMLVADPAAIDAARFEALAAEGRLLLAGDAGAASLVFHEALALWRGRPLEEFTYEPFAAAEIARLEELRLTTVEDRISADLDIGRSRDLVSELESLVRQHPLRERLTEHLMVALYRSGRQSEALRAFGSLRNRLGEELGLEPSAEIAELEERIVLSDPELLGTGATPLGGEPEPGLAIRGYELRDKIGEGAMGHVYRAYQPAVGREVAIKVIRPELADNPTFIRRFEAEAHLIAGLEHPSIAAVFDYWREPGSAYLVMRRFDHGSLRDVLASGALSAESAVGVISQVGAALVAAHRKGVTHGDLKPANVLMDEDGNAYLTDFGISLGSTTRHDDRVFAAPEQLTSGMASPAADVYALGALADHILGESLDVGRRPEVAAVLARATAEDPDGRYPDIETFLIALTAAMGTPLTDPTTVGEITNPYRGLRAFDEEDAERYFGRERLIERILARLGHPGPRGRFVALVGPSGAGKSSVIRAGVVPAIRRGALSGSDRWFIVTMTPGGNPFDALEEALEGIAVDAPRDLHERLVSEGIGAAAAVSADTTTQILVIVDQLEELFSLTPSSDAEAFLTALAQAANDKRARVKVVTTLRADFYDRPLRHRTFGELLRLGTEVITPMSAEELHRAISSPAEGVGVSFEAGLVTRIVSDMSGQSSALPLLQYALTELFERRTGTTVTAESFEELGGVHAALARRADQLYHDLDPAQRAAARDVFLRLVTVGEGVADTRRRALVGEISDSSGGPTGAVLDTFGHHRLLTFDRDPITRSPTVEIAHEALLTEWSLLAGWVDDARLDIQAERRLEEAAAEWRDRDHNPDFLLSGARLARFDGWIEDPPVRLTPAEREFLTAAQAAAETERELEQRGLRRLRRLVTGIGAALVLALAAGGVAAWQQQRAQLAAEEAQAQTEAAVESARQERQATLISLSSALRADDPELSLLLALEAHRREPGPDTEQALLTALGGASISKRVASLSPLPDECVGFSTLPAPFHGEIEFATVGGRLLIRDPLVGEIVDLGSPPAPCAVGAVHGGAGAVVTPDLSRGWFGSDLGLELAFEVPTRPEWVSANRVVLRSGLFEDEPDVVAIHELSTGALLGTPVTGEIWLDVAVNADETLFAISFARPAAPEGDGRLFVVDATSGREVSRIDTPDGAQQLAFDPATGNLVAAFLGGRIATFDPGDGTVIADVRSGTATSFLAIRPGADGLLTSVSDGSINLIDPATGVTVQLAELQDATQAFIRPDGYIVTRDLDGQIDVLDINSNAIVDRTWRVYPSGWVAFHAGYAAVLDPGTQHAEVVELATGERFVVELEDQDGSAFRALAAFPEADGLWALSLDHELARWRDGEMVERLSLGTNPDVVGVRLGRTVTATRYGDHLAVLGRRSDGGLETSLVRLDRGGAVVEFIMETPGALTVHPAADGGVHAVTTEGVVQTYGSDGTLTAEVASGQVGSFVVTLDPSGRLLALGSEEGGVTLVDTRTREVRLAAAGDRVSNLGFGPDGSVLAIALLDGTVRLWDTEQASLIGIVWQDRNTFGGEPGWYDATTESLWMGASGALIDIPLEPDRWVRRACEIVGRELTAEEWNRFVSTDEPQRSACS